MKYEPKTYRYKGYSFRATTIVLADTYQPLYEIDGLKEVGKRPFLTSIAECKEYINRMKEAVKEV